MSRSQEISDDEQLVNLLRLIVTRHPGAQKAISDAFQTSPHLANSYLTFNFLENGSKNEHECRCHYEHEYMTYVTASSCDFESFSHVAKNVLEGHCRHASSSETPSPIAASPLSLSEKRSFFKRRHSCDFDLEKNVKSENRLTSRRSSSSLRSLEFSNLENNFNSENRLATRRSSSSLRSLELSNLENNLYSENRLTTRRSSASLRSLELSNLENNLNSEIRNTRRASGSSRSLELSENNRRPSSNGLRSRRSLGNSLRSLAIEVEDVKGQTQTSLIHAAAAIGDGGLLLFLMNKAKVSMQQIGNFQLSPLHIAIMKHRMGYLKQIILRPETYLSNRSGLFRYATISPGKHGHKGRLVAKKMSLIGLCIAANDLETMQDLLNKGLLSDIALERGLKEAVEEDSPDATEIMLQCGARPDLDVMKIGTSKSAQVFDTVFRRFRKDFTVYALQHPQHIIRELLLPAVLSRNYGVLQVLIQNGAPVNSRGFYSPLTCAVLENQPEVVKLLLEHHADKTAEMQGYNLLDLSMCMGFTECSDELRHFGMKRKTRSIKNGVHCNLLLGMASKLDLLQDQGKLHRYLEQRHQPVIEGDTVLHVAIKTKLSPRFIREILKTGSNVNAINKKLESPLMCAVSKEGYADIEIIRELLYYNPILEQSDKSGKTTLMLAISRDCDQRAAAMNSKTSNHIEVQHESIGTLLLECGYNVKFDSVKKPHHTMYALRSVWRDLAATIGCGRDGLYVQHNPKTLKARSREMVRRCYPGGTLHKVLAYNKISPEISDYILMVSELKIDLDD